MLRVSFARGHITGLRRTVTELAAGEGLAAGRLEDFVLAVNEVATNAVVHGGGHGRLRLWTRDGRLWCEVADDGPGLPPGWMGDTGPPMGYEFQGRGLWLTRMVCEHLVIVSGPRGTTVTFASAAP
ncbi:ATP-binding protein [Nonomuraea sp. B1E8]|uniref:ATP-binding protein n=1 Tax=unclassified Nonomuraea TaxID=2593643 RepID=UPI00325CBDDF